MKKTFQKGALKKLESLMSKKDIEKSNKRVRNEILRIKLAELRKSQKIRQIDIKSFTQSALSRLEARKDFKVSTLIDYVKSLGMDLEIKAISKSKSKKKEFLLVRT